MTSLSATVFALLNPLASGGAWRSRAGQGVIAPYIVFLFVPSSVENQMDGAPVANNTRLQVDVYATTPSEADSIMDAVTAAMQAAADTNTLSNWAITSPGDEPDPDTRLYRVKCEWSIWS